MINDESQWKKKYTYIYINIPMNVMVWKWRCQHTPILTFQPVQTDMINNRPFTCTVWLLPVLSSYKWLYVEALVYTRVTNIRKGESEHCQIGCHWRDAECIISDSRVSDRQLVVEGKETARGGRRGGLYTYRGRDELRPGDDIEVSVNRKISAQSPLPSPQ